MTFGCRPGNLKESAAASQNLEVNKTGSFQLRSREKANVLVETEGPMVVVADKPQLGDFLK